MRREEPRTLHTCLCTLAVWRDFHVLNDVATALGQQLVERRAIGVTLVAIASFESSFELEYRPGGSAYGPLLTEQTRKTTPG